MSSSYDAQCESIELEDIDKYVNFIKISNFIRWCVTFHMFLSKEHEIYGQGAQ